MGLDSSDYGNPTDMSLMKGGRRALTAGTSSLRTSCTALNILIAARFGVSSHWMSTCSSSFRCSQFGFPRFISSYNCRRNLPERHYCLYLFLVSHRSPSSHHNLASGLLFELFRGHSTRPQYPTNKIVLKTKSHNVTLNSCVHRDVLWRARRPSR